MKIWQAYKTNYIYPLGVRFLEKKRDSDTGEQRCHIHVAFEIPKCQKCGLIVRDKSGNEFQCEIPLAYRQGRLIAAEFWIPVQEYWDYLFFADKKTFADEYASLYPDHREWGQPWKRSRLFARVLCRETSYPKGWEEDGPLQLPATDDFFYGIHVRGFTMDASSNVKAAGTFIGLTKKITYLKSLSVTGVVLMPVYTFLEQEVPEEASHGADRREDKRLNYWGFQRGYYYAPNGCFSEDENPGLEFRKLVQILHRNGLEVLLRFYFPNSFRQNEILPILRYWRREFHIDGFYIMGQDLPWNIFLQDPFLADAKLLGEEQSMDSLPIQKRFYAVRGENRNIFRKYLKGDEGTLLPATTVFRRNPGNYSVLNYVADYDGFRLADFVSYERKHNEENGEGNTDGTDYNDSWNWGVEGETRKKAIQALRLRLMKAALTMVFFSQGVPYLYMGDEFGFSQKGNNNPYCQDNAVSWLNWKWKKQQKDLFTFTQSLIAFRKSHPLLHGEAEPRMMDYKRVGIPDISYHGEAAWKPEFKSYNRSIGVLLSGAYSKTPGRNLFLGYNMHWQKQLLAIPDLPTQASWKKVLDTGSETENCVLVETQGKKFISIPPRTICAYESD